MSFPYVKQALLISGIVALFCIGPSCSPSYECYCIATDSTTNSFKIGKTTDKHAVQQCDEIRKSPNFDTCYLLGSK